MLQLSSTTRVGFPTAIGTISHISKYFPIHFHGTFCCRDTVGDRGLTQLWNTMHRFRLPCYALEQAKRRSKYSYARRKKQTYMKKMYPDMHSDLCEKVYFNSFKCLNLYLYDTILCKYIHNIYIYNHPSVASRMCGSCRRTCSGVASRMCVSANERYCPTPPHPTPCVEVAPA